MATFFFAATRCHLDSTDAGVKCHTHINTHMTHTQQVEQRYGAQYGAVWSVAAAGRIFSQIIK